MLQREALRPRLSAPVQFALALAAIVVGAAIAAPLSVAPPTVSEGYINGALGPRPAGSVQYRDVEIHDGALLLNTGRDDWPVASSPTTSCCLNVNGGL